jgi:hypothetical protein
MAPSRLPKKRNWGRPLGPPIKDPIRIRGSGVRSPGGTPLGAAYRVGTRPLDPGNRRVLTDQLTLGFFPVSIFYTPP